MQRSIAVIAFVIGCSSAATPPKIEAGAGIKIDEGTQTVSVDSSKVPMLPDCAQGQIVQRGAGGQWSCAATAPNSDKLGSKAADEYALKSGTVANADGLGGKAAAEYALVDGTVANASALDGHLASEFLGASAAAVDSARLGGHLPADFLLAKAAASDSARLGGHLPADFLGAGAKAVDSARLEGHAAAEFLAVSARAADSSKLAGLTPDRFVLQDPATHKIDLQGDIQAHDNRLVVSNTICLVSDKTGCLASVAANTSVEGLFCGATAATFPNLDGVVESNGSKASGYRAAKLVCEKVAGCSARAHMCTSSELIRSESLRVSGIPSLAWYANGESDCSRWTNNTPTASGSAWIVNGGAGRMPCATALSIACCD